MKYLENFKFLRKELKILLYISLVSIILIEFIFFSFTEIFPKANTLASIFLKICYSYISALIFYFLVVHYKRQDEKRKYYKVINIKLNSFISDYNSIFKEICRINDVESFDYSDKEELKKYLKSINPYTSYLGMVYVGIGNLNWMKHIFNVAEKTKKEIEYLFLNSPLIEIELINILNELNNNLLFNHIRIFNFTQLDNKDFVGFSTHFYCYSKVINELKEYISKEIEKYQY